MRAAFLFLFVSFLLATTATAAVPDFVNYSGRLTDGTGAGQSTTADLTFRIYDCGCPPGGDCAKPCATWPGDPIYEKPFPATPIEDGYFNVILTGITNIFTNNPQTWIAVCVGGGCGQEAELSRQPVSSVPYAVKASKADAVNGKSLMNTGLDCICVKVPVELGEYATATCPSEYQRVSCAAEGPYTAVSTHGEQGCQCYRIEGSAYSDSCIAWCCRVL